MDKAQAAEIRNRDAALHAWLKEHKTNSYHPRDLPPHINPPTNEERSAVEVFEFMTKVPERYFLYIKEDTKRAITFTGDTLGDVQFGREWRDNSGGKRQAVTIDAINGARYHGTYFKSSGNYARVKKVKGTERQPPRPVRC